MSTGGSARNPVIQLQRAYDEPGEGDGYRVLVDRYWPRGRSKEALQLDEWARDLAPEPELIRWFGHKEERWDEFRRRYREHLQAPQQVAHLSALRKAAGQGVVTLIYGARSAEMNQAVVLCEVLREMANSGK